MHCKLVSPKREDSLDGIKASEKQRHQAVRVVITTQEPSINTQLLGLCSIIVVHRCTSSAWFNVLRQHVAALYLNLPTSSVNARETGDGMAKLSRDDKALFQEIV
jgi:hypothetical protein